MGSCQTHLLRFPLISWLVRPMVRQIARGLVARGSCASGSSPLGQDCHKSRPAGRLRRQKSQTNFVIMQSPYDYRGKLGPLKTGCSKKICISPARGACKNWPSISGDPGGHADRGPELTPQIKRRQMFFFGVPSLRHPPQKKTVWAIPPMYQLDGTQVLPKGCFL